jgi:uncharacterized 2Fe-2S/4Fe-4S cluster protein (DUF4445 family)
MTLDGPAAIEIPAVVRSLAGKSFGGDLAGDALARPRVQLAAVSSAPAAGDSASALDRLATALGREGRSLHSSPSAIGDLGAAAGASDSFAAAVDGDELVSVWPGAPATRLGLAVDVGTTSLAAALVRLDDGSVLASASCLNPQVAFGADVIARIKHATDDADGLSHLARAVRDGLARLVSDLAAAVGCEARDVVVAAVAGNPTMMHAWLGVPMTTLGRAPYLGVWSDGVVVKAAGVELPIHPNANVLVFPLVRSHVGGDAVAAAVACDLDRPGAPRLLIDLGTNTEVLVAAGERIVATSAAAGPAFEGVTIRHGMRAAPGAIDVVSIGPGGVVVNTISGLAARGICGSGLIDAVAELLRAGIVTGPGYLRKAGELDAPERGWAIERLAVIDGQQTFVLASGSGAPDGRHIVVTARDIREVQLAKGAIVAAATLACRHLGIGVSDLDAVLVAGAFGNYIRKASALRIGLVPSIDPERVHFVGNAAGVGARLAVVDRDVWTRARALAARAEYLELATHPDYQPTFMSSLMLGSGDISSPAVP